MSEPIDIEKLISKLRGGVGNLKEFYDAMTITDTVIVLIQLRDERDRMRKALESLRSFIYCDMGAECAEHGHWEDCAIRVGGAVIDNALKPIDITKLISETDVHHNELMKQAHASLDLISQPDDTPDDRTLEKG